MTAKIYQFKQPDETTFDGGNGPVTVRIKFQFENSEPEPAPEPKPKSTWGAFGLGALAGLLFGGD